MKKLRLIIVPVICSILFSGCGKIYFTAGISNDNILKIEGSSVAYQEALIYLGEEKGAYESSYGDDVWDENIGDASMEDYVKDVVKNKIAKIECMNLLAQEEDISLSTQEASNVSAAADEYYSRLTENQINDMGLTKKIVYTTFEKYALAQKIFDSLTGSLESQISDSDAKMIKVQSIFMATDESKMNKILKKLKNGEDFYTLAQEYTEDDQIEYTIKKGETLPEFEDAAYALKTDEFSGVISTEKGYYIIKCISDYLPDESAANKKALLQEEKEVAFQEVYNSFADKLKYEFNESLWEKTKVKDISSLHEADFYGVYDEYCK